MPSNVHPTPFVIAPPEDLLTRHPHIQRNSNALAMKYAFTQMVEEDDLQIIGAQLWQALALDDALNAARAAAGRQVLPLVVRGDSPTLQQLPWETLYHPEHGFLGRNPAFTLSRNPHPPATGAGQSEALRGPLRILLFTSLPDDVDPETSRLDVEKEQAEVQAALAPWIAEGTVLLEMPDDGRLATLRELLKRFDPHLLFLSGHGKFHGEPHQHDHYATFAFEDEHGRTDAVRGEALAEVFIGSRVRAVVLSACESGRSRSDALNAGLAQRLSLLGVPHVIGMRESLLDVAGIRFARALADGVATGERLDVALQAARQAIIKPLAVDESLRRDGDLDHMGELSLGQWCLPMLLTSDPALPLLDDWAFERWPPTSRTTARSLQGIVLPPEFVGRRSELRNLKGRLRQGKLRQLLITGPGGQGKTALAGKLAQGLQAEGYTALAWAARPENRWDEFVFDLELRLDPADAERYDRVKARYPDAPGRQAEYLLSMLLNRHQGRLLLFLDNLESVQDPDTLSLTDPALMAWIEAARGLTDQGLILLLTSRWKWPTWPEDNHHSLRHPSYGDFLQMARREDLPAAFFKDRDRPRRVYQMLHGNGRGLTFFAAAIRDMNAAEEGAFLAGLADAAAESQTDMAIETVIAHLPAAARTLLERLPAYQTPVPQEGIFVLAPDLPDPAAILDRLTAVSLVEHYPEPTWQSLEYQIHPLVSAWLDTHAPHACDPWLETAARYQRYLCAQERHGLNQRVIVHTALRRAGQNDQADRFALDYIVGPLNRAGLYRTLLTDWLPPIRQSADDYTRAEALNSTGKQHLHLGEYDTALQYLQQSLAISQEIGNRSGEGSTLNNISQIYHARGDYDTALQYLEQSLAIAQEIGDISGEGVILNGIAVNVYARGDYDTALQYLNQSLAIQQEIGDKSGEGTTLNNISQIFKARGDYDTALQYLKQSLAIRQEIGDISGEGVTLNNMATIAYARDDYDTALNYFKQSLAIQQETGDKSSEGTTLNNISQIYHDRGDYDTALQYLQQSLAIQQEIGDVAGLCATLFNMGHIHWQNEERQQALSAWVTVYQLARKMNLAQSLSALAGLAKQLDLPGGLQGWDAIAEQMDGGT